MKLGNVSRAVDEKILAGPGRAMKAFWVLCLIFGVSQLLGATTYYVAKTGNDSNNGSQGSPWLTIQHAADRVAAGDTVLVENGTYIEAPNFTTSGTAGSPIVFQSQNRWGAVIAPTGNGNMVTFNASYMTLTSFEIIGNSSGTAGTGVKLQQGYTNGTVTHNKIHRFQTGVCGGGGGVESGQSNSVIDSNLIYNFGDVSCDLVEGIYLEDGDSQVVTNNIIGNANATGSTLIGIQVNGQGALTAEFPSKETIANNLLFNLSGWGIAAPCWNIPAAHTCDHNIFNNNIFYSTGEERGGFGSIKTINNGGTWGANNTYANNLIYNSNSVIMASGQTLTGTVTSAPLFVNYIGDGTGDYHEASGSPSIDAGTAAGAPKTDFDGNSRPQGAGYDIGPYEYISASLPAPPTGLTGAIK